VLQAGVDADNILAAAHTLSRADKAELQERTLLLLTNQIDRFLASRSVNEAPGCQLNVRSLLSTTCCKLFGHRRSVGPAASWVQKVVGGAESCSFPTDSCKYATEKIMGAPNFILPPECPLPQMGDF